MINLNNLSELCFKISEKRQKNGDFGKRLNTTENLLKYCATEVVEAINAYSINETYNQLSSKMGWEHFNKINDFFEQPYYRNNFISELADIICCVLVIAGMEKIDIEKAILDCIDKNLKWSEK